MKKVLAGFIVGIMVAGCSAAVADNTSNDHVLRGDKGEYQEFFKQDAPGGDKNYIYTISQQDAPPPGKCLVITVHSEVAVTAVCNIPRSNG